MSDAKCSGCGAPAGASPACEFCGRMLRQPASAEDEIAAVRAQSQVAQRLNAPTSQQRSGAASFSGAIGGIISQAGEQGQRQARMAEFWQNAYMPTTVEALRLALQATMAAAPEVHDNRQARQSKELLTTLFARAETLANALRFHPSTPEITRQEVDRSRRLIHDRRESLRIALTEDDVAILIMGAVLFCMVAGFVVGLKYGLAGFLPVFVLVVVGVVLRRNQLVAKRPFDEKA